MNAFYQYHTFSSSSMIMTFKFKTIGEQKKSKDQGTKIKIAEEKNYFLK